MYINKISLYFLIKSDVYSPHEITSILGIDCDEFQLKGEEVISPYGKHTGYFRKTNSWILSSRIVNGTETEDVIKDMLLFLDNYTLKISNLANVEKVFSLGVQFKENVPGFNFDAELLKKIADLGASLDISLYDMKT